MAIKGIEYFEDITCRPRLAKFHLKGYKTLYTVEVKYGKMGDGYRTKVLSSRYGNYKTANQRYMLEISPRHDDPSGWEPLHVTLMSETYKDTKMVCGDVLRRDFAGDIYREEVP